jgi:hypothetical protein
MAKRVPAYHLYYKTGQPVAITCRKADSGAFEKNAEILSLEENRLGLDILGDALSQKELSGMSDGTLTVSGRSGYGVFRCRARFGELRGGRELFLTLFGDVEEQQRREYFRMDVCIPVTVAVPEDQNFGQIKKCWEESRNRNLASPPPRMVPAGRNYRVLLTSGEIPPQEINLSGGGMRLKMPSPVPIGSVMQVDLYLPLAPLRVITAAAEVLRCNEITLRLEKKPVYVIAMKFILIDEKDRESIIAYIFTEQRLQLQSESER